MEGSESVASLERLLTAFEALLPDTPGLMVDRRTQAPPDAIGWRRHRNFRVRLRRDAAVGQASAYYRVGSTGLELMLAASCGDAAAAKAGSISDDGLPDGEWTAVRVPAGEEPLGVQRVLEQLREPGTWNTAGGRC